MIEITEVDEAHGTIRATVVRPSRRKPAASLAAILAAFALASPFGLPPEREAARLQRRDDRRAAAGRCRRCARKSWDCRC